MIDEIYKVASLDKENINVLQKTLAHIHEEALGILYVDKVPTEVPYGKLVIYDNGSGTKRIYLKTGQGNIGYITLT